MADAKEKPAAQPLENTVRRFVADGVLNDGKRDYKVGEPIELSEKAAADLEAAGIVTRRTPDPAPSDVSETDGPPEPGPGPEKA